MYANYALAELEFVTPVTPGGSVKILPETTRFTIEMKVQSTFYIDFISKTVDVLLISSFITKQMPKLLIFDAFTLLICKKNVAIYALLRCKIFSLKIWLCKIFDKFHVCEQHLQKSFL